MRAKLAHVLFVALEVPPGARSVGDRRVAAVRLWAPAPDEEAVLRADFELFVRDYFRRGRAARDHRPPRRGAAGAPKGATPPTCATRYDADGQPTRIGKMGFYLRPAFVARILGRADGERDTLPRHEENAGLRARWSFSRVSS